MNPLIIAIALITSQFFYAPFPYFYDFVPLMLLLILVLLKFKPIPIFILISLLYFIIIILLQWVRYPEYAFDFFKNILPIFRWPLYFLLFGYLFKNISKATSITNFKILTSSLVVYGVCLNFIALLDANYYISFLNFIFNESYSVKSWSSITGVPTSVSSASAMQGRFSSGFLQPVASGQFYGTVTFLTYVLFSRNLISKKYFFLIMSGSIFSGYISDSAVMYFFMLPIFLYIIISKLNINYFIIIIISAIFSGALLIIITYDDFVVFFHYITSGRYASDGNAMNAISNVYKNISLSDILFGFSFKEYGYFGKGLDGDSGYIIKIVHIGVIGTIYYYYLVVNTLFYIFNSLSIEKDFRLSVILPILVYYFLIEFGTNAYSLPQVTLILASFIFLTMKSNIKSYV